MIVLEKGSIDIEIIYSCVIKIEKKRKNTHQQQFTTLVQEVYIDHVHPYQSIVPFHNRNRGSP